MFWWFWPGGGWVAGLVMGLVWLGIIVAAVVLLRRELPHLQHRFGAPPALRLLEERYAQGEISRDEFLERRRVLLQPPDRTTPAEQPPPPPTPHPGEADPTQQLPPPA